MTRKRMYDSIKGCLEKENIELTDDTKAAVDVAVSCALNYVQDFAQQVSHELISGGLYSEAMVAGVIVQKIKALNSN